MEVPIWLPNGELNPKFAELDFANATYINGAIVMTMKNGCEGNLVIIPVQREKYVPPVVVPPRVVVPEPQRPQVVVPPTDVPETEVPQQKTWTTRYCDTSTHTLHVKTYLSVP